MDRYSITYTPADLGYVRQMLGQRPFDEVVHLIADMAQQRAEQDRASQAAPLAQPVAASVPARTRRGRPPKAKTIATPTDDQDKRRVRGAPAVGNGSIGVDTGSAGL
jgi:hypothetical protein